MWNLPFQLCDVTLWMSALACLTLNSRVVEFAYFGGLAGAGMALMTPDLWTPWPSYPAIYFFVAHGGIVLAVSVLVFGRIHPLRAGAVWRAFGMLLGFAAALGAVNAGGRYQLHVPVPQAEGRVACWIRSAPGRITWWRRCGCLRAVLAAVAARAAANGSR